MKVKLVETPNAAWLCDESGVRIDTIAINELKKDYGVSSVWRIPERMQDGVAMCDDFISSENPMIYLELLLRSPARVARVANYPGYGKLADIELDGKIIENLWFESCSEVQFCEHFLEPVTFVREHEAEKVMAVKCHYLQPDALI